MTSISDIKKDREDDMAIAHIAEAAPDNTNPSARRLARVAGLIYLTLAIFGAFAHFAVRGSVYVPGDAVTTAERVIANAGLVRAGVVADLFAATLFLFLGLTLYALLKHVSGAAMRTLVVLVAISTAITSLNMVFQFITLRVAIDESYTVLLGRGGSAAMVLILLDLQHYGYLISQIFFGLWLLPLGYVAYISGLFPRPLGVLLIVGGIGYLVDMLAHFLVPDLGERISEFLVTPSTLAEVWMLGYLLTKGVRIPRPDSPPPTQSEVG